MPKFFTLIGPFLKRTFHTNAFTTVGGLVCVLAVVLLAKHLITAHEMLEMLGIGGGIIGFAAKDGTRLEPVVAPESLTAQEPAAAPAGSGVATGLAVLLVALVGLSACAPAKSVGPAKDAITAALATPAGPPSDLPSEPDSLALPVGPAVPPYLVQPPADLTPRERRQFRRAQRQALKEASRTTPAKVKLGKGAAYAGPDGTAVSQRHVDAPASFGAGSAATDNSKLGQHANGPAVAGHDLAGPIVGASTPPTPGLIQRVIATIKSLLPWLIVAAVVVACVWLKFLGGGGAVVGVLQALTSRNNK